MTKTAKKNRKLKRQVRKTIGGLFMASAIVIAALPVQDVSANPNQTEKNKVVVSPSVEEHTTINNEKGTSKNTSLKKGILLTCGNKNSSLSIACPNS